MADPATLGLMAAGSAVSAFGTLAGGASANAAAKTSAEAQVTGGNMAAKNQVLGADMSADAILKGGAYSSDALLKGGELTAKAQEQGGIFSQQGFEYQAEQAGQSATMARAGGQRQAFDVQRQQKLALSTLQANAAASGGGADDQNVVQLAKDIAGRGEYEALTSLFNGENTARGYEDTAAGLRYSGAAAKYGADESASATRFGSKTQSDATLYDAESRAAATKFQGYSNAQATAYGAATGANAALTAGENAKTASYYGAAGTILSGAGSVGKTYSDFSKPYRAST